MRMLSSVMVLWLSLTSMVSGAEPFARASMEENERIVPGQQIHLTVDVFAPNFFTSPPQFPLFDLPDAIVTMPDQRAQNLVQTIDGVQYSGIRRTYAIVPERAENFTLPQISIELVYSNDGKPVRGTARLPPVNFIVSDAPGGVTKSLVFAARGLELAQSFDRDMATLKAGDAIVRTITIFAANTQAMMIPPVDIGQSPGLETYTKPPVITDGISVNKTVGSSRTETITYLANAAGRFEIPQVSYSWLDLDTHEQVTASLPATVLVFKDAPARAGELAPQPETVTENTSKAWSKRQALVAMLTLILVVIIGKLVWQWRTVWSNHFLNFRESRINSEGARFRRLIASVKNDDPATLYRSIANWSADCGFRTIADWSSAAGNTQLALQIDKLEHDLFADKQQSENLDRNALSAAIASTHRKQKKRNVKQPALPELNPF